MHFEWNFRRMRGPVAFCIKLRLPRCAVRKASAWPSGTAQRAHSRIARVPFDDASERLPRYELHDLREQRLAHVHASLRVVHSPEHRNLARLNSNRGHP